MKHPLIITFIAGLLIGSAITATIALHIVEANQATTKAQLCDILNDNYESFNNCLLDD